MKILDYIAFILVIVGAINWGLIGLFNFNLVIALFGYLTIVTKIVYSLIGLCGLYSLTFFLRDKYKKAN